jgi:hypothetical protein
MIEENSEEPQDNWSVGQDLNPGHPSEVLSGLSKCSTF